MIAFVRGVTAASTFFGSRVRVSSSTSTRTGAAPVCDIASVVAMNVFVAVITSSPRPIPSTWRARWSADVPLLAPTACLDPVYSAKCRSKRSSLSPPTKAVLSRTSDTARSISFLIVLVLRLKIDEWDSHDACHLSIVLGKTAEAASMGRPRRRATPGYHCPRHTSARSPWFILRTEHITRGHVPQSAGIA